MNENSQPQNIAAPLWRRLAAMLYDALIVLALLMLATVLLLPFNQGKAYAPGLWWFQFYLVIVALLFFLFFWKNGGQTLGMRAWKIKLVSNTANQGVSWQQLLIRAMTAMLGLLCFGLGFLWALFDKNRLTVHDRLSGSTLIMVSSTS